MDFDVLSLNKESNKYCQMGNYEMVIKCCNKMLDHEPDNVWALSDKGNALFHLKKYAEAIHCFDKVLEVHPEYRDVFEVRKFALEKLGKD